MFIYHVLVWLALSLVDLLGRQTVGQTWQ